MTMQADRRNDVIANLDVQWTDVPREVAYCEPPADR
jgi:hypothetical protein